MIPDERDAALDDATHAAAFPLEKYLGRVMTIEELYRLNDAITAATPYRSEAVQESAVDAQRRWIAGHGGNLAGYIMWYGSKNDPDRYGHGGEAIWAADNAYLQRLIDLAATEGEET